MLVFCFCGFRQFLPFADEHQLRAVQSSFQILQPAILLIRILPPVLQSFPRAVRLRFDFGFPFQPLRSDSLQLLGFLIEVFDLRFQTRDGIEQLGRWVDRFGRIGNIACHEPRRFGLRRCDFVWFGSGQDRRGDSGIQRHGIGEHRIGFGHREWKRGGRNKRGFGLRDGWGISLRFRFRNLGRLLADSHAGNHDEDNQNPHNVRDDVQKRIGPKIHLGLLATTHGDCSGLKLERG